MRHFRVNVHGEQGRKQNRGREAVSIYFCIELRFACSLRLHKGEWLCEANSLGLKCLPLKIEFPFIPLKEYEIIITIVTIIIRLERT